MERSRLFSIRTRIRMDRFSGVCKRRHVGKNKNAGGPTGQVSHRLVALIWSSTRDMHEHYFEQEGRQEGRSCYYLLGNLTWNYLKRQSSLAWDLLTSGRYLNGSTLCLVLFLPVIWRSAHSMCSKSTRSSFPVPLKVRYTVKKGIILLFSPRERLLSDIPAGVGKISKKFLHAHGSIRWTVQ